MAVSAAILPMVQNVAPSQESSIALASATAWAGVRGWLHGASAEHETVNPGCLVPVTATRGMEARRQPGRSLTRTAMRSFDSGKSLCPDVD
jgi:hypothetical protein